MNVELETEVERYADVGAFAREVNLPLLATARVSALPAGADLTTLLAVEAPPGILAVVDRLAEARRSLTLRSLLLAGFPHDPELFGAGLALARAWSRRGVRVAVIDLAFDHPTVVRRPPEPAEGLVDMLEYGCSFRRVAWEVVAGSLWLVGTGSHPPDEGSLPEHPEWGRTSRSLASSVDVALYVAPLLHHRGFTGALSKRMDGALLVTSVERATRGELRDAFLELWGSDAPMIGCVGLLADPEDRESDPPVLSEGSGSDRSDDEAMEAAQDTRPEAFVEPPDQSAGSTAVPPDGGGLIPAEDRPDPILASYERGADPVEDSYQPELEEDERLRQELTEELLRGRGPARRFPLGVILGAAAVASSVGAVLLIIATYRDAGIPHDAMMRTLPTGLDPVWPAPPAPPASAGTGGMLGETLLPKTTAEAKPYTTQVASFRSERTVQSIVRDLNQKGVDAWYKPAPERPGWYRVYAGRFETRTEAMAYAEWIVGQRWVEQAIPVPTMER